MKLLDKKENCSNVKNHTTGPDGYWEWHVWIEKKSKTHIQEQCPKCGYYVIWRKK